MQLDENLKIITDGEITLECIVFNKECKQFVYFIYDENNNEVGVCTLRLSSQYRENYLGNIGYEVIEEYRGNNYALKATKLLANVALYYEVDNLIITVNPSNTPSVKTISKLGAKYINVLEVPKECRFNRNGNPFVELYEWDIRKVGRR